LQHAIPTLGRSRAADIQTAVRLSPQLEGQVRPTARRLRLAPRAGARRGWSASDRQSCRTVSRASARMSSSRAIQSCTTRDRPRLASRPSLDRHPAYARRRQRPEPVRPPIGAHSQHGLFPRKHCRDASRQIGDVAERRPAWAGGRAAGHDHRGSVRRWRCAGVKRRTVAWPLRGADRRSTASFDPRPSPRPTPESIARGEASRRWFAR
jgi:hypothetical protein